MEMGPWEHTPKIDTWVEGKTCSFCRSLHPDLAIQEIMGGAAVGTTDKNYKIYLGNGKVYFQHFEARHRGTFIDMMNLGKIKFEGDLGFYVMPFFARRKG